MRKKYFLILLFFILLTGVSYFLKIHFFSESKTAFLGEGNLVLEYALTSQQKVQGLSDRKSLCANCGLLFVFDSLGIYPFWMKAMYFDIDIIWLRDNQVAEITYGAKAPLKQDFNQPKEIFQSQIPINGVLEVNAGWVEKNQVKIGDVLKY